MHVNGQRYQCRICKEQFSIACGPQTDVPYEKADKQCKGYVQDVFRYPVKVQREIREQNKNENDDKGI